MNHRPRRTSLHRPIREGLTGLLCSFRVSLAATSFNTLVRPWELHRRVSGHLQRCSATWKHNKIMRKHLEIWSKKQRIFRLKKCMGFGQHVSLAIHFSAQLWFSSSVALPWLLFWISYSENHQPIVPTSSILGIFRRSQATKTKCWHIRKMLRQCELL